MKVRRAKRSRFFGVFAFSLCVLLFCAALCGGAVIDVTSYGADGDDTLDDTAAIGNAVNALTDGDTLLFPEAVNYYKVSLGANFSIHQKDRIKIIIRGKILATGTPDHYEYIFSVLASNDIQFIGEGSDAIFEGPDEYLFFPDSDKRYENPAFLRAEGCHRLLVKGITFRYGPTSSLTIKGAHDSMITDCRFQGGPTYMDGTYICGILFTGVYDSIIKSNDFEPLNGGYAYSWISGGSKNYNYRVTMIDNTIGDAFDHSFYCTGMHQSVIANNVCYNAASSAIKTSSNDGIISNNTIYDSGGGASARDGSRNIIANNTIKGCWRIGINFSKLGLDNTPFVENTAEGNIIIYSDTIPNTASAIRMWGPDISGSKIINNIISNPNSTSYAICYIASDVTPAKNMIFSGNIIDKAGYHAIHLKNIQDLVLTDNIINVKSGKYAIYQQTPVTNLLEEDNIITYYSDND